MNFTYPMACPDRNRVPVQADRLDRALARIRQITREAGHKDLQERDRKLARDPYLLQMCDTSIRCRYGTNCPGCRRMGYRQELARKGREAAKGIVLAGIVDPAKARSLLPFFSGDFPRAARYISELGLKRAGRREDE